MQTTDRFGGLTLGAFADGALVGYSYGLAGFDGRPFLLSCGLVVAPGFESRGIGMALKLAQARHARRAGYDVVRWTTNALASRPLRLYLSKLGARLVRYHAGMYREAFFPDEVEIEWDLRDARPKRRAGASHSVEIPWDRSELERTAPEEGRCWLARVREAMPALLADGFVGTAVDIDVPSRRSFVRFER
jgi:predicted GNAT superfamily acetyltransferase